MITVGNNRISQARHMLLPLLNVFFFMPLLMVAQEQKSVPAPRYTTPLATGVRLDPEGEFLLI